MSAFAVQERRFFTAGEIAQRWGISRATALRLMRSGELPSISIGARRFVTVEAVERAEVHGVGKTRQQRKSCRTAVSTTAAQ